MITVKSYFPYRIEMGIFHGILIIWERFDYSIFLEWGR